MNNKNNVKNLSSLAMLREEDAKTRAEFEKTLAFLALPNAPKKELRQSISEHALRQDKARKGLEKETLLSLAPEADGEYIILPKALEKRSE